MIETIKKEQCDVIDIFFFFQAEDGIRDLVRSRGLGDVYKRQVKKATDFLSLLQLKHNLENDITNTSSLLIKTGNKLSLIHI